MELEVKSKGLNNYQLKIIAIIAMLIDHIAAGFVPYDSWLGIAMHFIGRITGPVMFYMAVEGYHHTSNLKKYITRLGIFAIISYFPFMYFNAGGNLSQLNFLNLNVIYTIFLGVIAVHISRKVSNLFLKAVLLILILVISSIGDWGITGIIIMLGFDYYYGNFKNQAFNYFIIVLMGSLINFLSIPAMYLYFSKEEFMAQIGYYKPMLSQVGMLIPIFLLNHYNGERGNNSKFSKWLFYIFYPLHLLILGFIVSMVM